MWFLQKSKTGQKARKINLRHLFKSYPRKAKNQKHLVIANCVRMLRAKGRLASKIYEN